LPEKLAEIKPFDTKPRYFDALLGSPKPHRDFVHNAVLGNNLTEQIIAPYGGDWKTNEFYAKDYFVWEPDCVPQQQIIGTADWVSYHGHQCHLSQVMPLKVYNDTAYTIIAETDCDNTLSFYSEKTAKAMIARRLFVAFSGYKFLENLRKLGFQTFDGVIDESYDLELNDVRRFNMAFQQVKKLSQMDYQQVQALTEEARQHNFERLYSLEQELKAEMLDMVYNKIKEIKNANSI
jgi:hypothetical protein